jgi:RNA polymerase sigma factor (sigma-70 family)
MWANARGQSSPSRSHSCPWPEGASTADYRNWLVENLPLVRQVVLAVCQRYRLAADDQAELTSAVSLKLVDDDYAVLRQFKGRSSVRTFLFIVARRVLLDWRDGQWGKWRPSMGARRLGPSAVLLEQLTVRDGLTVDEAIATLGNRRGPIPSNADLRELHAKLPARAPRRKPLEGLAPLEELVPCAGDRPDAVLERQDLARQAARVQQVLRGVLVSLDRDERTLLRRRFSHGESVADIARASGVDPKAMYRRFELLLRRIRQALESEALNRSDVRPLVGQAEIQLGSVLAASSAALCLPDRTWP